MKIGVVSIAQIESVPELVDAAGVATAVAVCDDGDAASFRSPTSATSWRVWCAWRRRLRSA